MQPPPGSDIGLPHHAIRQLKVKNGNAYHLADAEQSIPVLDGVVNPTGWWTTGFFEGGGRWLRGIQNHAGD